MGRGGEPTLPTAPQAPLCPAGSLHAADPPGPRSRSPPPAPFRDPAKRPESLSCSFTYRPDTSRKVKAKLKVKSLFTSGSPFSAAPQTAYVLYSRAFERSRRAPRGSGHGDLEPSCQLPPPPRLRPPAKGEGARGAPSPHLGICEIMYFFAKRGESLVASFSHLEQCIRSRQPQASGRP